MKDGSHLQAVTSVLCLLYRPETVHCSTKDAYISEKKLSLHNNNLALLAIRARLHSLHKTYWVDSVWPDWTVRLNAYTVRVVPAWSMQLLDWYGLCQRRHFFIKTSTFMEVIAILVCIALLSLFIKSVFI